ncbi:hypothetical protein J2Z21_007060 [Streptomyces griseochromogenes]|uniref:Uncharacterized protein n=1 Tax=Streptomyces griseochromogenes TaxID=68214 RepID=A0A1B1AQD3_9ACTN|nr:hypothetical protein [Streptomyces griseochromogenes]ANP48779.1 hypothetical protein AVL59_03610 [Streptomyces griseochromogenes]MBP2054058.1 hypothetical protein [Streptomyces griseochromogenes]
MTAVTFAEDPAHPESWLRDVLLQWWNARDGFLGRTEAALPPLQHQEASRIRGPEGPGVGWISPSTTLDERDPW